MTDRETVITHLMIIHTWAKFALERDLQFFTPRHLGSITQWVDDTLELLKEQEPVTYKLVKAGEKSYPFYDLVCTGCGNKTGMRMDWKYCPGCGKEIEWDGETCSRAGQSRKGIPQMARREEHRTCTDRTE